MYRQFILLTAALAVGFVAESTRAAAFTPGNLAVYRVGDGSAVISSTPAPVFIDEYNPTNGMLVQSIAMPSEASGGQNALVAQGSATLEGLIHRSTDGQYLTFTGYNHKLGDPVPDTTGNGTLAQTTALEVNRTIGRIDFAGNKDTSTSYSDSGQGSPRSVISDQGVNMWIAQGGIQGGMDGRVRYTTFGTTATSVDISSGTTDPRSIGIFGEQLYGTTQSINPGTTENSAVFSVGTGKPTTTGQTNTGLPGIVGGGGTNIIDFFMADMDATVVGLDTIYVSGDANAAITKYNFDGTTWAAKGTVGINSDDFRGITGVVSGSTVTIYATRAKGNDAANTPDELVSIIDDSGFNGTLAGAINLIADGGTNKAFKGVALVPVAAPPQGLIGDYNSNNEVDAADYVLWRDAVTSQTALANDPLGLPIDNDQYDQWKARFGQTSPAAGSGIAFRSAVVPEPAAGLLLAIAGWFSVSVARLRKQQLL